MAAIGLFGGSFNPTHVAHALVALYVLETQPLDEVWLTPTFVHPFGKELAPFEDRLEMCRLAMAPLADRVRVSDLERELAAQPGFVSSRTLDLLDALEARHPEHRFRLVIGSDILRDTDKWHRWDEIVRRAPPIVIGRAGQEAQGHACTELSMPGVSSTEVRRRLARGEPVGDLLPSRVVRYIRERGLYR
ncbi:MAG: nicotinate (nicotinamide) nucleotide adenylyltransferase [Kofleriaceae bacterium]